jgi:hypothetical protein
MTDPDEPIRRAYAQRVPRGHIHPAVRWWHHAALADAICVLAALPADPRLAAALGHLDRLEIDWRAGVEPPWTPLPGRPRHRHHRLEPPPP